MGAFGQGTQENIVEVFKLGEKLVKGFFKLCKSLVTRKDEAGIVAKAQAAKSFLEALFAETKQDWENPEAYRARLEAAEEIARELRLYDQFYNAEAYHLEESKKLGYISLEAVQFVCGEAIFKGTANIGKYSVKLVKGVLKIEKGVMESKLGRFLGGLAKSAFNLEKNVENSKLLGWGKNSSGHLIAHRAVLGFAGISAQEAQKILPELRSAVNQLFNKADLGLTRVGRWHQHKTAIMYICNGKMIVTEANGRFITIIDKTSNNWYRLAKKLK